MTADSPSKLVTFTAADKAATYKLNRDKLLARLLAVHLKNEKGTGVFCSDPNSIVTLTILPENESKVYRKQYPIVHALRQAVTDIVNRWYKEGKIEHAPKNCKFNSPLLAVPKKDDNGRMTKVRVCIDIRAINKYLVENDKFEIPHIPDLLSALAGGTVFGEYDLSEAYFQFKLSAESRKYTAFTWEQQQYVFVGTPFGLKHIPSLFQRYITSLFRDMPFVFPYIDNLGFASSSWEQHYEHSRMIIDRLTSVNLRIKPGYYNLGNSHMKLLGHVVSKEGVSLDPDKVEVIQKWPLPSDGANLASALGLGAYLRDHIRNYADIAAPLEAVKKQKIVQWNDNLRRHWLLFKRAFATAPILSFPNMNKRFVLACDASQSGVGGILYQPTDEDNTITPHNIVAICSKQLGPAQRNYPIYKKELWAVVYCLRKFHTFVWGRRDVQVLTDHKPLIHVLNQRVLAVALQQWLDVLLDYDLTIKYRPGVLHVIPDALSRMYMSTYGDNDMAWGTHSNINILDKFKHPSSSPSDFLCTQSINESKPLTNTKRRHRNLESEGGRQVENELPIVSQLITGNEFDDHVYIINHDEKHEFLLARSTAPLFNGSDFVNGRECMSRVTGHRSINYDQLQHTHNHLQHHKDDQLPVIIRQLAVDTDNRVTEPTPVSGSSTTSAEDKLLLAQEKRGKIIPSIVIQQSLIKQAHEAGHYGEHAMYDKIAVDKYWWPGLRNDIKREIADCVACRQHNTVKHGYHPSRSVTASQPGDHYMIDLAQLPASLDGKIFCLVLIDVFTGFIILRPLADKTAQSVARELWDIFCLIGIPRVLQSDNGTEFVNSILATLNRLIGVNHRFITAYNPRADGKVERVVRTVKLTIMKLLHGAMGYWPLHVPYVQYAYNDKLQLLTGSTAFILMFGRRPNAARDYSLDPVSDDSPTDLAAWKQHQTEIINIIYPSIAKRVLKQQSAYRERLDNSRPKLIASTTHLAPGTTVYVKDPKYLLNPGMRPSREGMYVGPYTIDSVTHSGNYKLIDDTNVSVDRAVPLDQIKVVAPAPPITTTTTQSSTNKSTNNNVFQVESILSHRESKRVQGRLEYLVKWTGYPLSAASWVIDTDMNDTACVEKYYRSISVRQLQRRPARAMIMRTGIINLTSTYGKYHC